MNFSPSVFLPLRTVEAITPVRPHLLAQRADQVGVFGEALDQDGARAVERGGGIGHLLFGIDEAGRDDLRIVLRLRQQQLGQRLEAGFLGDLGLGAALRLERQIDVFQPSLAVGGEDRRFQRGVELALLADRIEDGGAALLELAQIVRRSSSVRNCASSSPPVISLR